MRSPEGSHESSSTDLATILVAIGLAVSSCSGKGELAEETHPYPSPSVGGASDAPLSPRAVDEEPMAIDYNHPFCAEVRAAKAALYETEDPAKAKKGVRSRIVDTKSGQGADGTRSDSVLVASGSGTPQDVRRHAETSQRFFSAARAAGGLEKAMAICLERRHVLGGKPPKGK